MPIDVKERMKNILESQQMKSLKKSENPLSKCEETEYKCIKCRDMTFIIDDGVAIPCECRALRVAEDILNKSGIGKEFRNKRFDNFDFSRSIGTMQGYKSSLAIAILRWVFPDPTCPKNIIELYLVFSISKN